MTVAEAMLIMEIGYKSELVERHRAQIEKLLSEVFRLEGEIKSLKNEQRLNMIDFSETTGVSRC